MSAMDVEQAVQRHVERAEYRFDVAIADLLGKPRPESPDERATREAREAWVALGQLFGDAVRTLMDAWAAVAEGYAEAFKR